LAEVQRSPGYPLEVLKIVAGQDAPDPAIQQASAVHFKNTIKKGWDVNREDGNDGIVITPVDRNTIKSHLVQLMCTVPAQIQVQLSEAISLIASVDYPDSWQNLLPELVQQFQSPDPAVVIGVLTTANSIFKGFRYVQRSDELYRKILFSLVGIQVPLLALFTSIRTAVEANSNDAIRLKNLFISLRLVCRIFYSLNYQDLPEFFEDHMSEWMAGFSYFLEYTNPLLEDADEEIEPSVVVNVKVAIIANLSLYANKDEESFMDYLPKFTTMVWHLLMNVSSFQKHDMLATRSIKFLSSLLEKEMHKPLFSNEATLREIVLKIVIPNLMFRESDEERFEDDPKEYMLTEIEGSDSESRRKCSHDLLKSMCRQFENETTTICSEHVSSMLLEYSRDASSMWTAKDAAVSYITS
jgi:exportin-2 (importin alpha re-exporter)